MAMRYLFTGITCLLALFVSAQKYFLFVGTYTGTGSKGIYVYEFDAATGTATWISNTDSVVNPSFLVVNEKKDLLYACTETRTVNAGGVSAFRFNRATGKLSLINKQSSGGDNPAYVSVSKKGDWIIAGNYSGGSLAAFPVTKDGGLQPYRQLLQHQGSSVNKTRQEKAHVHATVFSPEGDHLFVPDLGLDKLVIYRFDATQQQPLTPADPPFLAKEPGSGPRHFTFHPNNKWAYLVEEMAGAVSRYEYVDGKLKLLQHIATHPDTLTASPGSADIHVSPDGQFLYASNRGRENNLAIFQINQQDGTLTAIGYQETLGQVPRNFCIDPSGKFLLAANQETGNVVIFKRDVRTGLLTPTGQQLNIPKPVCLVMMKK
jgi:6-phosphogluconolactonase